MPSRSILVSQGPSSRNHALETFLGTLPARLFCYHPKFCFFQAKDGIRYTSVTGVQTCALPISVRTNVLVRADEVSTAFRMLSDAQTSTLVLTGDSGAGKSTLAALLYRRLKMAIQAGQAPIQIGRAAWRGRGEK